MAEWVFSMDFWVASGWGEFYGLLLGACFLVVWIGNPRVEIC
jgi:hypothetical protein